MSNIKKIFPILLVLIMVLSWYTILDGNISSAKEYNQCVDEVKAALKDNLPEVAKENIEKAFEIKDSPDLVYLMADYYSKNKQYEEYINWLEIYYETYIKDIKMYEYICYGYMMVEDYSNCITVLEKAASADFISSKLKEYYGKIRFSYEEVIDDYSYISTTSIGGMKIKSGDMYGIVNKSGSIILPSEYIAVGGFVEATINNESGYCCAVIDRDGKAWVLDTTGNARENISSRLKSSTKYTNISQASENMVALCDETGNYTLIDMSDYTVKFSDAEYIGAFRGGYAPVKKGGAWFFIDKTGTPKNEQKYEEIKVDDFGVAVFNDISFVKTNGKYYMINEKGEKVSETGFDDVKPFDGATLISVKSGDKWGFVDEKAKVSFNKYEETTSFMNGYAGVKESGKWKIISTDGKAVLKDEFDNMNGFVSFNTAVVADDASWSVISFFRSETLESKLVG